MYAKRHHLRTIMVLGVRPGVPRRIAANIPPNMLELVIFPKILK